MADGCYTEILLFLCLEEDNRQGLVYLCELIEGLLDFLLKVLMVAVDIGGKGVRGVEVVVEFDRGVDQI